MKISKPIVNNNITCPICGSHKFRTGISYFSPKLPVLLLKCSCCERFEGWMPKYFKNKIDTLSYEDFKNNFKLTEEGKQKLNLHKLLTHFGFETKSESNNSIQPTYYRSYSYYLTKNQYNYKLNLYTSKLYVKNLETKEVKKYPADKFINQLKELLKKQ